MKNFRLCYRQLGGHVHVRVFSGSASRMTHAGDLVFDEHEWPMFVGCLKAHDDTNIEVVHEDEPLPDGQSAPVTAFEVSVALLWQEILSSDHSDMFARTPSAAIDRAHGHDRIPQPGFVGPRYRQDGILLIAQNPGKGGNKESEADAVQFEILHRLRAAPDTESTVAVSRELMAALASSVVMRTWRIVKNVALVLLKDLDLKLDDVAYINLVKFRTSDSDFGPDLYQNSWPQTLRQIELLKPKEIVVLGYGAHEQFQRLYEGNARVHRIHRMRNDVGLSPQGRRDIDRIVGLLRPIRRR
jgi:hypothetical protein